MAHRDSSPIVYALRSHLASASLPRAHVRLRPQKPHHTHSSFPPRRSPLLGLTGRPRPHSRVTKRVRTYNHLLGRRHGAFASNPARSSPKYATALYRRITLADALAPFGDGIVTPRTKAAFPPPSRLLVGLLGAARPAPGARPPVVRGRGRAPRPHPGRTAEARKGRPGLRLANRPAMMIITPR